MATSAELEFVPIEDLTRPVNGRMAIVDNWWLVHPEQGAAFYRKGRFRSPQCNRFENVTRRLAGIGLYEGLEIRMIPVAFVSHSCHA